MNTLSEINPLITVCIPTYNRAHYLRQCLHSLSDQGLSRDQYVIAISDNASTDETPDLIATFQDRLQILYRRNPENVGHLRNFELVTALCTTPYITLLPDDDLLAPGHLGRAMSALHDHPDGVLVSSLAVVQTHPGDPHTRVHGTLLRAGEDTSYEHAYLWDQTEWFALALVTTPLSLIGSVFQTEAFKNSMLWKKYPIWGDRILLAEMALHGKVLTLPWIGGYYRVGGHQTNFQLGAEHPSDFDAITREVMSICETHKIPVIDFWIEQITISARAERTHYLRLLKKALPPDIYRHLLRTVRKSVKGQLTGGRLESWGVPDSVATLIRAARGRLRLL